ncbi:hypothetical protein PIB30_105857, partial [Stylosanthes scabra]|nr:hypothetical protein [Stylosanthes scabra]
MRPHTCYVRSHLSQGASWKCLYLMHVNAWLTHAPAHVLRKHVKADFLCTVRSHGYSCDRMSASGRNLKEGETWNFKFPPQGQASWKAQFEIYEERIAETQG